jgi:TolB-like protein
MEEMKMKKIILGIMLGLAAGVCWGQTQLPRVAVAPFTAISGNAASDAETIAEIFGFELQAKNVVRVYTRGNTLAVMNEHRFQMSDLSSEEKTASIGKAANADWVVRGQVQKLGAMIVVTASLLDVNTLELMAGAPMYLNAIEEAAIQMNGFITLITQRITGGSGGQAITGTGGKVYQIGDFGPAGGWIFYDKGRVTSGWRYLEAAPTETEFMAQWGAYQKNVEGTSTSIGTGKRNTEIIVNYLRSIGESGKAAQLCDSLVAEGFDDWFLPSKDELDLLYKNLKAKGIGELNGSWYWSSSQYNAYNSWYQDFSDGDQYATNKGLTYCVRAVRAF